jgi:nicotinamidase-related amidase
LEKILNDKGIKTVVIVGTAAQGAVLNTASQAAFRGLRVIIPVDGMSAENTYFEQYTTYHLANARRRTTGDIDQNRHDQLATSTDGKTTAQPERKTRQ